jgi:hypothetical protein
MSDRAPDDAAAHNCDLHDAIVLGRSKLVLCLPQTIVRPGCSFAASVCSADQVRGTTLSTLKQQWSLVARWRGVQSVWSSEAAALV